MEHLIYPKIDMSRTVIF